MTSKVYRVTDVSGEVHSIACDFMFNNDGELVFRAAEENGRTDVVAMFAKGGWTSCVRGRQETRPDSGD